MTISGSAYLTPVSYSVPFDNSTDGFQANNVQAAIEESLASAGGLQPFYLGTGLIINYKAGRAWVNGTLFISTAGTITVGASLTNNFVYMGVTGTITSGSAIPSNAVPIAQFTSSATLITTLTDIRGSLNNNVDFGLVADIQPVVYATAVAGATNRFADAGHQHVLAITVSSVSSQTNATTTSATDVALTSMTLTPVAGTYFVFFDTSAQSTAGGNSITFSIYVGGTQVVASSRTIQFPTATLINTGYPFHVASQVAQATVNGSQAISVEWHTNGGTATCLNRTLTIIRTA